MKNYAHSLIIGNKPHGIGRILAKESKLIGLYDDAGNFDIIWYGDDWGTQSDLFLPPDVWRKIIKPHTKRIYDCMKERNIIINQHSCGKIEKVVGDIVEIGVNVWNPCQPCNDLKKSKQEYGDKLTFEGDIDSQFALAKPGVTEEEACAEVRKRIDDLAEGGGYIASPSHSVPYEKNILDAMVDEITVYGSKKS